MVSCCFGSLASGKDQRFLLGRIDPYSTYGSPCPDSVSSIILDITEHLIYKHEIPHNITLDQEIHFLIVTQEQAPELQIHQLDYTSLFYHAGLRLIWNNLIKAQFKCKMDTTLCENVVLSYWIQYMYCIKGFSVPLCSQ